MAFSVVASPKTLHDVSSAFHLCKKITITRAVTVTWPKRRQMIRNKTDPKIFKCFEDFGPFSSHTNHININNINKRVIFTVTSSHSTKHNHTITHSSGGSILSTRRWNGDEETLFKLQTGGHSQTCCWNEWVFYSLRVVATDRQSASRAVSCRA